MPDRLPTVADVHAAAMRLRGVAVRTPLLRSDVLDERTGRRVFLKAENLQRTGSFKFRGAYNAVSQLAPSEGRAGVFACSSGNHAQGVAAACALLGYPATIVMPSDAPETKKAGTRAHGARIVEYDRYGQDRDEVLHATAAGRVVIHPYEAFDVIAGQGTVGLEMVEDLRALQRTPDRVLCCAGGGGLTAGVWLAVREAFPDAVVHTCEPEGFDDQARSIAARKRLANEPGGRSVCDAIVTPTPGRVPFAIYGHEMGPGFAVRDEEVLDAVAFGLRELKVVLEPGGAVALATLLHRRVGAPGETVVATLSGGNVDPDMLARAMRP